MQFFLNFLKYFHILLVFRGLVISSYFLICFSQASLRAEVNRLDFLIVDDDIIGWKGIIWGTSKDKAKEIIKNSIEIQNPKFKVGDCNFSHATPLIFLQEKWYGWLCEDSENRIIKIAIEKGWNGTFFDKKKSQSNLFYYFLDLFTSKFGPAHIYWKQCHNSRWNFTEEYLWNFKSSSLSLLFRDIPNKHLAIHIGVPQSINKNGPGICYQKSQDLRK